MKSKMTNKMIDDTLASIKFEGYKFSDWHREQILRVANGEITKEEYIAEILKRQNERFIERID